jgi:uncharacterized membrane protein
MIYRRITTLLSWLALAALWVYTFMVIGDLPDTIPVHFNFNNEPDNWGSKHTLWVLPGVATVILGLFDTIKHYPDNLNYPVRITEANKARQQSLSLGLLSTIGLVIPFIMLHIVHSVVESVRGDEISLSIWVILAAVFIPIGVYFYLAMKAR